MVKLLLEYFITNLLDIILNLTYRNFYHFKYQKSTNVFNSVNIYSFLFQKSKEIKNVKIKISK